MDNEIFLNTFLVSGCFDKDDIDHFKNLLNCDINLKEYYNYIRKLIKVNNTSGVYGVLENLLSVIDRVDNKQKCANYIEDYKRFLKIYMGIMDIKDGEGLIDLTHSANFGYGFDEWRRVGIRKHKSLILNDKEVSIEPVVINNINQLDVENSLVSFIVFKNGKRTDIYIDTMDELVEYLHNILVNPRSYDLIIYPTRKSSYAKEVYEAYFKRYKIVSNRKFLELSQLLNGTTYLSSEREYNNICKSNANMGKLLHIINKHIDMCEDINMTMLNMVKTGGAIANRLNLETNTRKLSDEICTILEVKYKTVKHNDNFYYINKTVRTILESSDIVQALKTEEITNNISEINLKNTSYLVFKDRVMDMKSKQEYTNIDILVDKNGKGRIVPISAENQDCLFCLRVEEKVRKR